MGDLDRAQVSAVIDQLISRRARGLCTYKQARVLVRYGYDPDRVNFAEAHEILDDLARHGGGGAPAEDGAPW